MPFAKGQSGNPAGRKPKATRYARQIAVAERRLADNLPERIDNLEFLAAGGYEQITETWEMAGGLTTGSGETLSLMFPDKKPDELVLIKRTRIVAAPDRAANVYLVDRVMGRPKERQEAEIELTGANGGPIEVTLSDEARAERIARLLDGIRARAAGSAASAEPDLGTAAGAAD